MSLYNKGSTLVDGTFFLGMISLLLVTSDPLNVFVSVGRSFE